MKIWSKLVGSFKSTAWHGGLCVLLLCGHHVQASEVETKYGAWTYLEISDKLDDTQRYIAYVSVGDRSTGGGALIVKCDRPGDYPYVSLAGYSKYFGTRDSRQVRYRVDSNPPVSERWRLTNNSVSNLNRNSVSKMINEMATGASVIIEAQDFQYKTFRLEFALYGSDQALTRVVNDCTGR